MAPLLFKPIHPPDTPRTSLQGENWLLSLPEAIPYDDPCAMTGRPDVPALEQAIDDGDEAKAVSELARARERYPLSHVEFAFTIDRAIEHQQLGVLRVLLQNAVPANTDHLRDATVRGNIGLVECLRARLSCNVNDVIDDTGQTLLNAAMDNENEGGSDDLVDWILRQGADPNMEDAYLETPFSRAMLHGSEFVIRRLLDAGADVTKGAPLQLLLQRRINEGKLELLVELLRRGASPNKIAGAGSVMWDMVGFPQPTPLHTALKNRNPEAIEILLDHGADPTRNRMVRSVEVPDSSFLHEYERMEEGYLDPTIGWDIAWPR